MSDTLNRRVEAASACLPAFDAPDTPDIIAALDAADAAVNLEAALGELPTSWEPDVDIRRHVVGRVVFAALGRQSNG